jgi:hypothetical protein
LADFGRGIKAGAAVAAGYLVISIILELTGFSYQFPVITAAGLGISLELTDPLLLIGSTLGRVVQGVIFGAVFAALYDYLPGTTSVKKGVVFSSLLWVLVAVELVYTTIPAIRTYAPTDGFQSLWSTAVSVAGVHVSLPSISKVLAGIISALALGALTGLLWGRFRATRLVQRGKGSPVLLVSFALGVWMWASSAVGVILTVVNEGALVIEPGPLWWVNILHTLVTFIGPVGWVLALVAWRKTKRGESGLKLGVAGGVIMALTGLMLLPGALAVTGGVLSKRKPTDESGTAEIAQ